MLISAITANYNGSRYLETAIKSVLSQSHRDFEYIIVDDGSTDDSRAIINHFHDRYRDRIVPIYLSSNRGQGHCFNIGINAAKGSVISFLDSDDYWFDNKLENVASIFELDSNIALFQHNLAIHQNNELSKKRFADILFIGDYFHYTRESRKLPQFVPTSGLAFRKGILEAVLPIPKSFKTCADGYLTRTCFIHGLVASTYDCLGAYRVHDANRTFGNSDFNFRHYLKVILVPALNHYYESKGLDFQFTKSFIMDIYQNSPRDFLKMWASTQKLNTMDALMNRFG